MRTSAKTIVASGMPRSGSTLVFNYLLYMCQTCYQNRFENLRYIDLHYLDVFGSEPYHWESRYQSIFDFNNKNDIVLFKSHCLKLIDIVSLEKFSEVKPICTIRSIQDAAKSLIYLGSNHDTNHDKVIRDTTLLLRESIRSIVHQHPYALMIDYTRLITNPISCLKDIVNFASFDVNEDQLHLCCEKFLYKNIVSYLAKLPEDSNDKHCLWNQKHLTKPRSAPVDRWQEVVDQLLPDIADLRDRTGLNLLVAQSLDHSELMP